MRGRERCHDVMARARGGEVAGLFLTCGPEPVQAFKVWEEHAIVWQEAKKAMQRENRHGSGSRVGSDAGKALAAGHLSSQGSKAKDASGSGAGFREEAGGGGSRKKADDNGGVADVALGDVTEKDEEGSGADGSDQVILEDEAP